MNVRNRNQRGVDEPASVQAAAENEGNIATQ
jgi:hypothetical protein